MEADAAEEQIQRRLNVGKKGEERKWVRGQPWTDKSE